MARMPGAAWVPLANASKTRMAAHDIACIHTMVGSLMGTDGYFRRLTNGINSHFGFGGAGEPIRQWVDTLFRSGANLDGNGRVISAECADMGPGFAAWNTKSAANVPPFTASQVEDLARWLAWVCSPAAHTACPSTWRCHREGIPLVLIPDSKPGRRGVGYHRLGCDPYRVAGGEKWSSSRGKVCPADRRIAQIPQIIARARQLAAGNPTPQQEDDMPLNTDDFNKIRTIVDKSVADREILSKNGKPVHTWEILRDLYNHQKSETAAMAALTKLVAEQNGLSLDDVRRVVSEEVDKGIAKGIAVDVTVKPGT